MKNYEKYADEIEEFDGYPDFCEQKILKPLGKSCEATDCCYCNLLKIVWLLEDYEEPKEPEVDWSKVAVDTPIFVKDSEDRRWLERHFAKYEDGVVYAWSGGYTSWTADGYTTPWEYAKLAETEGVE